MINKLPCTYLYIKDTKVGERNHKFFRAINHLRKYNPKANLTEITEEAIQINKEFDEPLKEQEVKTVALHAFKKDYKSTCQIFKKYCRHCQYGSNRKNGVFRLPHGYKYYLWDILDTSELSDEDKLTVQRLRESKGIDPQIDDKIKLRGFPVGDEALRLFMDYLEK